MDLKEKELALLMASQAGLIQISELVAIGCARVTVLSVLLGTFSGKSLLEGTTSRDEYKQSKKSLSISRRTGKRSLV